MRHMSREDRQILAAFGLWAQDVNGTGYEGDLGTSTGYSGYNGPGGPMAQRAGNLFERDRYVTPANIYEQMKLAYRAIEDDDVVSGVLESTEALAFGKVSFYADDEDEED